MKDNKKETVLHLFQEYGNAHSYLVGRIKSGLYGLDKSIFDKLDFYDDAIYLDPFFFACLIDPNNRFKNCLIGSYQNESTFNATTDEKGLIYLPKAGVFLLEAKDQEVKIQKRNDQFFFKDVNGKELEYISTPIFKNAYDIEFLEYDHPFVTRLMKDSIITAGSEYKKHFNSALEVIKTVSPELFALIIKAVKKVVFFKGRGNSFATLETHGIIYLNVKDEYDVVSFVDDIVHQSSHVIFNTLTFKTKANLFTDSYINLRKLNRDNNVEDLYSRFHGLYTMSLITDCLTNCLNLNLFVGDNGIELIGRIVDNMKKFKKLIHDLVDPQYFTEEASMWFTLFKKIYCYLEKEHEEILMKFDVSNQPYVFNLSVFKKTNLL